MTLTKIDDRGLKTPIDLLDNEKIRLGTGNDLEIFHDGSATRIVNSNGNLLLDASSSSGDVYINSGDDIFIRPKGNTGTENGIKVIGDGAVELYYDNSNKLLTTSGGVTVYGSVSANAGVITGADNAFFYTGAGNDLQLTHNGTDSYIRHATGSGQLQLRSREIKFLKSDATGVMAQFIQDGAVELYHNNSKKFETTANGVKSQGTDHTFGSGNDNPGAIGSRQRLAILGDSTNGSMLHIRGGSPAIYFDQSNGNFSKIYQDNVNLAFYAGTPAIEGINILTLDDNGNVQIPNDNANLQLGASQDLRIYHDGTNSHIKNVTGYLQISATSTEVGIWVNPNASVRLAYDGAIKLDTLSNGVKITGLLKIPASAVDTDVISIMRQDNANISLFRVFQDSSAGGGAGGCHINTANRDLMISASTNANVDDGVYLKTTGDFLIGTSISEDTTGNSGPKLIHTGDLQIDGDQKSILFRSTNSTAQKQSGIQWWNENGAGVQCAIFGIREAVTQAPSALAFYTTNNVDTSSNGGQGNITDRMRITSLGECRLGHENNANAAVSSDPAHAIGACALNTVTSNLARLNMQERSSNWISFKDGSGNHYGTISRNGSGVSYGSNSDYRLKDNVANLTNGIALVKQLRPVTFNWNDLSGLSKTETHQGFIAHEVQALLPDAVSGEKDGMEIWGDCRDGEGNLTQTHVPESKKKDGETWAKVGESIEDQQLDTGKLIPILTKALQEAIAKIETLETKVAVLEAA